jgi:phosphoribosyl 1,2-cyclic phosphodiesterase
MKNHEFTVKFWGVRGSHPVPGESTTRYGGNTPCVEIHAGGHTIILDAGTGIIGLGRSLIHQAGVKGKAVEAVILFSHLHHDHTQGFPFFAPTYFTNTKLHIFVPDIYERDPKAILTEVMSAPTFPVAFQQTSSKKYIHSLRESEVVVLGETTNQITLLPDLPTSLVDGTVIIRARQAYAHPQGVMYYRIEYQDKSVVYATDTEGYVNGDQRLAAFARQADLLIHDAQYTEEHYIGMRDGASVTQGFGHSTAAMACRTAKAARVGQLVLFHHDPNYDDATIAGIEREAREHFPNSVAAREGQTINLRERIARPWAEKTRPETRFPPKRSKVGNWAGT